MKHNTITRTIAGINSRIFKDLHNRAGFDFEKPFAVRKMSVPFTLKKVQDALPPNFKPMGYTSKVVVLIHYGDNALGYRRNNTYAVEVIGTGAGDFNTEIGHYARSLDWFYRKSDFNEARRFDDDAQVFVIAQLKENLGAPVDRWRDDSIKDYITRDKENADTQRGYDYDYEKQKYTRFETVIDKSGYHVELKQNELKNKAKALRAERQKAAFCATDNTVRIEALKKRADVVKEVIKAKLDAAKTSEDIRQIEEALSHWRGFGDILDSLERLAKGEREKTFASQKDFDSIAEHIEKRATTVITWNF